MIYNICNVIYPPLCLRRAGRVVLTSVFLLEFPDFLLHFHPPAGNPSGNPASSIRESDRFMRELTESQFSQQSRYPGNSQMATTLTQNLLC